MMVLIQANQSRVSQLLIATLAGIAVLVTERIVTFIIDYRKEAKNTEHARNFLAGWLAEVTDNLFDTEQHYGKSLQTWKDYLEKLEASPGQDIQAPKLTYDRIHMPDISNVVISASSHMPEAVYVNLLHLNAKLKLIDERGRRLADFFDNMLLKKPKYGSRVRVPKSAIEALDFIKGVVVAARINSSNADLNNWIMRKPGRAPIYEKRKRGRTPGYENW